MLMMMVLAIFLILLLVIKIYILNGMMELRVILFLLMIQQFGQTTAPIIGLVGQARSFGVLGKVLCGILL